ncbi:universal stress protein [Haloarcula laminariae]|uniref:universal stress protein n=1 Tax=Haloarcula laminariae TaxID=2961577 RepID=UPI0021C91486|nr:universal stress protein [Halomicroarcula laminariae]
MTHAEANLQEFLERSEGPDSPPRVLYPIFSSHDRFTFEIALNIAEGVDGELLVLDLLTDDTARSEEFTLIGRKLLQTHLDENHTVDAHLVAEETNSPLKTAISVVQQRNIQLVVLDEHTPDLLGEGLRGDAADQMRKQASCDVVSVTDSRTRSGISSVLVPLAEGKHSGLGVVVGGALAAGADAPVDLFHVSEEKDDAEVSRVSELFAAARERLPETIDLNTWHLEAADVAEAIVNESAHYDVTVIGKPTKNSLREFVTGSITTSVAEESENSVLTVQRNGGAGFSFERN